MLNPSKRFKGKKLLLLGTNVGSCDMVSYAKSQGAYVIVTDNLSPERSAAKLIADESWLVSSADVDTIEKLAISNKINGISAGASEFNLEKALTLCERLGLPFFCTRKQWEICSNKQRFKQLCRDHNIPIAKEYHIEDNRKEEELKKIQYPVIVKPADSSSGIGIRICQNENGLLQAYKKAVSISRTNQAVVEQFVEGDEFHVGYTIKDGQYSLSCMGDRYFHSESGDTIPMPQASIWPSKYVDRYMKDLNPKVIKMFNAIGLANGFIFFQGKINHKRFYLLEANYRQSGAPWYRFISRINRINHMEMLVNHALTGKMDGYDLGLDNPKFNKIFL